MRLELSSYQARVLQLSHGGLFGLTYSTEYQPFNLYYSIFIQYNQKPIHFNRAINCNDQIYGTLYCIQCPIKVFPDPKALFDRWPENTDIFGSPIRGKKLKLAKVNLLQQNQNQLFYSTVLYHTDYHKIIVAIT